MSPSPFPIRHEVCGLVWLRDAFHVVAFLQGTHAEAGPFAAEAFERYLELIDADNLRWVLVGDEYKELSVSRRARILSRLRSPRREDDTVLAKGGCGADEVAAYGFQYWGMAEVDGLHRSAISFSFPTPWALERPADELKAITLGLLAKLPIISGYASLAIHELSSPPGMVQELAFRYPGLDVHNLSMTTLHVGDGLRGAYWMTVLGRPVLEKLGLDRAGLVQRLGSDISVDELEASVALTAGDELRPGDTNSDLLPLIRGVAKLIEPARFVQTWGIFGFRGNDASERFAIWHQRHLR